MNVDAATHLVVQVAKAGLILGAFLHIHVAPDEFRHIMNQPSATVLHEHLIGLIDSAAVQDARLVLGSDGNLAGEDVNDTLVKHLEQVGHTAGHLKTQGNAT